MTHKPLAGMSFGELHAELIAATAAVQAVEYQDGLASYMAVRDAACARKRAVEVEIDRRLTELRIDEKGGTIGADL
jgi:hypothetical protein